MKKWIIPFKEDRYIYFINTTSEDVEVIPSIIVPPYQAHAIIRQTKEIIIINQVHYPLYFLKNMIFILYKNKKGFACMPISISTDIQNDHAQFQVINLSAQKKKLELFAKFGDYLQTLSYQQKSKILKLAPHLQLVLNYHWNNNLWKSVGDMEIKPGRFYLQIITDDITNPVVFVEVNTPL